MMLKPNAIAAHAAVAPRAACGNCRHAVRGGALMERAIPGLAVFSSGFGASIGDSGLCKRHDRLVSPADHCAQFENRAD